MSNFTLVLPEDFEGYEWEATAKGWFSEAILIVSGKRYHMNFYNAVRLGQTIESEFERGDIFFEPNLVVLPAVTRLEMERAAEWLVQSGRIACLIAE